MGTIIPFPGKKLTPEEEAANLPLSQNAARLADHIVNVSLDMSISVFNQFDTSSLPVVSFDETNKRDFVLIHEAIKSAVSRLYGTEHELQTLEHKCVDLALSDIQFDDDKDL
jgi:hypothetical protein|tara:strand:- start:104 stop:439 length:336 start_codon:yes stop_codon:yes gene_type:complete